MLEFGARIVLAGALVLAAGVTGAVGFPLAIGVAAAFAVLATVGFVLAERDLYDRAGAGLHASLEALGIALLLVEAGHAESLGFLSLLPYAWVAARRRASWAAGAFAVSFALVAAHSILHREEPSGLMLAQAGGVLLLGLFMALRVEAPAPLAEVSSDDDLRGRFRALREAYAELEKRAAGDVHAAAIARATSADVMAQSLRDATSATGTALFAPVDEAWEMVGKAGLVPEEFDAPVRGSRGLQEKGATVLFGEGRPVGAVWVPEESRGGLAGIADALSTRFTDRMNAESERRRRKLAELRLTLLEGGDSPDAIARAVASIVGADSVEFGAMGPLGPVALGHYGPPCALPDALRHGTGPGIAGWAGAGAPTVWIADARQDERLDNLASLRARTSALALISLGEGRAYAWAAWHATGVGRPTALNTLRAAEPTVMRWLSRAATLERTAA